MLELPPSRRNRRYKRLPGDRPQEYAPEGRSRSTLERLRRPTLPNDGRSLPIGKHLRLDRRQNNGRWVPPGCHGHWERAWTPARSVPRNLSPLWSDPEYLLYIRRLGRQDPIEYGL